MPRVTLYDPTHEDIAAGASPAPRLPSLAGRRLGLLDNGKPNADVLLHHVAALLGERYGVGDTLRLRKGDATRPAEEAIIGRLGAACDAVVTAIGD